MDVGDGDAALLRLLHGLQLPANALDELRQHLEQLAAVPASGAGPHLSALAADLFRGSWFRLEGGTAVSLTSRGTRPGDPTADVLCAFCLSALHRSMDAALEAQGLLPAAPLPTSAPLFPTASKCATLAAASWADDCLRFTSHATLSGLLQQTVDVLQLCFERATAMGMQFASGPQKTAILVSDPLPGQRSCGAAQLPDAVSVPNALLGTVEDVPLVAAYKYPVVTTDHSPRLEVLHRRSLAQGLSKPLAACFFSNPRFPLSVRRTLLQALCVSRFVYGSSTLVLAGAGQQRLWFQAFVALWRTLLRPSRDTRNKPHSFRVLQAAHSPSPPLALAIMRAAFLVRLFKHGPGVVTAALQRHWELNARGSWLGQLVGDLDVVEQYVPTATVLRSTGCVVRAILDSVADTPSWWLHTVKKAARLCVQDYDAWCRNNPGHTTPPPADAGQDFGPPTGVPRSFVCRYCGQGFVLRKNLAAHEYVRHAQWSPVRHYAHSPMCVGCNTWWHTVRRVQVHLRQDNGCLSRLVHVLPPLTKDQIVEVETLDRERERAVRKGAWTRHSRVQPPQKCCGPLSPTLEERRQAGEELTIAELKLGFRPLQDHVDWIQDYLGRRSVEGSRQVNQSFWLRRHPTSALGSPPVSHACTFLGHG